MSTEGPFCKDCQYLIIGARSEDWPMLCNKYTYTTTSLVSSVTYLHRSDCHDVRRKLDLCGPSGRGFEPKQETNVGKAMFINRHADCKAFNRSFWSKIKLVFTHRND